MPAHLRPLAPQRCVEGGCNRAATVQLLNTYNCTLGNFCRKHGAQRLKKQLEVERKDYYLPPGSTIENNRPRCPHGVYILENGSGCYRCTEARRT